MYKALFGIYNSGKYLYNNSLGDCTNDIQHTNIKVNMIRKIFVTIQHITLNNSKPIYLKKNIHNFYCLYNKSMYKLTLVKKILNLYFKRFDKLIGVLFNLRLIVVVSLALTVLFTAKLCGISLRASL